MRRSRYTVYFEGYAVPEVVMGYTYESLRFWAMGHWPDRKIEQIIKGDYRKQIRRQAVRGAATGFKVDQQALNAAIKELGLKHPVKVRLHARVGSTAGNHRLRIAPTFHDIMLKSYETAESANETLWHELCHAVQAERVGASNWPAYRKQQGTIAYRSRPIEVEARKFATEHKHIKLVRDA